LLYLQPDFIILNILKTHKKNKLFRLPAIALTAVCLAAVMTASCDKLLPDDKLEGSKQTNQTSPVNQKPKQPQSPAQTLDQEPGQTPQNPSSPSGQVNLTWYVSQNGSSTNSGTSPTEALSAVKPALSAISKLYRDGKWPAGESAVIVISGRITGSVTNGSSLVEVAGKGNYPPVIFKGDEITGGTLDAGNSTGGNGRVLYIANSTVTLGDKLLLTGGRVLRGGAVCIGMENVDSAGELIIDGAEISGNTGQIGGAVMIYKGSASMSSGLVRNNKNDFPAAGGKDGGGIYVNVDTFFLLSGGTIENNGGDETEYGGGILIEGESAARMTGGKIINNRSKDSGGGVRIIPTGTFEMTGGEISGNTSAAAGGVSIGGSFIHTGGTITGNTP
jgi:hypothetical protein